MTTTSTHEVLTPAILARLQRCLEPPQQVVVTGATGWLGRALLGVLDTVLDGKDFERRVIALSSAPRRIRLLSGRVVQTQSMALWNPAQGHSTLLAHFAFLTLDKTADRSPADYFQGNSLVRDALLSRFTKANVRWMILPSAGAVYIDGRAQQNFSDLPYGALKLVDEDIFSGIAARTDLRLVIPRVFNLSGFYINKWSAYALASFVHSALLGGPISIRARQLVIRSYIDIEELLLLSMLCCLEANDPSVHRFDTAGAEEVEVGQLAAEVQKVVAPGLAIDRPELDPALPMNRYVGDMVSYQAMLRACQLQSIPLATQIERTKNFIEHALREPELLS